MMYEVPQIQSLNLSTALCLLIFRREKNTELTDEIKFGEQKLGKDGAGLDDSPGAGLEMIPTAVKEKLLRLQHENKRLKDGYKGGNNEPLQVRDRFCWTIRGNFDTVSNFYHLSNNF